MAKKAEIQIFERQDGESDLAWERFKFYRNLPPSQRKLETVAKHFDVIHSQISTLSFKHQWTARCLAYDRAIDEMERKAHIDEYKKMHRRILETALLIQDKARKAIENIDPNSMKARDIIEWWEKSSKMEMLLRGQATERTEQQITGELMHTTPLLEQELARNAAASREASQFFARLLTDGEGVGEIEADGVSPSSDSWDLEAK